ncbi:MAG: flavoprotein [Clostridiaceae bacterium]|nr:flavoprotein [Clostridiaceae bacterium]
MDIEDLLRPIIAQIINMMNKRVLLFVSGGAVNLKKIFEALDSIKMLQYDIVITDAAKKMIPEEYIKNLNARVIECKNELTKAVIEDDLVVVPMMSRNTLAKCATGIQDNLVTTGIAEALMMKKEVIAIRDSFNPVEPKNISLGFSKNPAYNKFILGYEDILTSFGVRFIDGCDIKSVINEKFSFINNVTENVYEEKMDWTSKKVLSGILTIEDIIKALNNSKEVFIKEGSLITPLAKDYIDSNKVNVKYCQ